jgi:hypothetical protein
MKKCLWLLIAVTALTTATLSAAVVGTTPETTDATAAVLDLPASDTGPIYTPSFLGGFDTQFICPDDGSGYPVCSYDQDCLRYFGLDVPCTNPSGQLCSGHCIC